MSHTGDAPGQWQGTVTVESRALPTQEVRCMICGSGFLLRPVGYYTRDGGRVCTDCVELAVRHLAGHLQRPGPSEVKTW